MADIRDADVVESGVEEASDADVHSTGHNGAGTIATPSRHLSRTRRGSWRRVAIPPAIVGSVLVGFWYVVSYVVLDADRRFLMPPPHDVVAVGFLEWENFEIVLRGAQRSATIAAIGLAISIVLGMAVAIAMSQTVLIERALFPFAVMLQAIPILAIVPLIGFWFGFGTNARVIVCVLISLFPIIVNTLFGLHSAERGMHDLFTLQHVGRITRLRKLMFPAALPAIFAGLRISAGLSVIGAIVGDFFFGQGTPGLGQALKRFAANARSEELFAAVIVSGLLGVAVFLLFGLIQNRAVSAWHDTSANK